MKVCKKGHNRYRKMQESGFGVFHGTSRYKRGGGAVFGMLAKSARSILPWVGKNIESCSSCSAGLRETTINKKKEC